MKAYYTAGVIYDALLSFGELSEEATDQRKYAKYKAAYIHTCLKNGETPVPGPPNEGGESGGDAASGSTEDNENEAAAGPSSAGNDESPSQPPAPDDQSSTSDQNEPIVFQPHPTEINGKYRIILFFFF